LIGFQEPSMLAIEMPACTANEVDILGRLFLNGEKELTRQKARFFLELSFSQADEERIHELSEKNPEATLTDAERDELLGYAKAGCLLGILHSRARRTLKKSKPRHSSNVK